MRHIYVKCSLIGFDGFNERKVGGFATAERIAFHRASLVCAVAYAGAESESFCLGIEALGFGEDDGVIFGEVFFEAVDVVVLKKFY